MQSATTDKAGSPLQNLTQPSALVCGYTCQDHLLVDLDNCNLSKAKKLARMIMRSYPELGSCIVVESSASHYHLVYDAILDWLDIVDIVHTLAVLGIVEYKYFQVRTFRRDLTLRISDKKGVDRYRPAPRPVVKIDSPRQFANYGGIVRYLVALQTFRTEKITFQCERL